MSDPADDPANSPSPTNSPGPAPDRAQGPTLRTYVSDEIGDAEDSVSIVLGNDQMLYCESWNSESSVLSQPGKWAVRIGFDVVASGLYYRYPPRTPFQLYVNGALQAVGFTDSRRLEQLPGSGGSELVITGRDALAPLHDAMVPAQQTFYNTTYRKMVQTVLTACGIDQDLLIETNESNRSLAAGVPISQTSDPDQVDELAQSVPGTLGAINQAIQAQVGQRWLEFLRKHLDRAGLMLWAGVDGKIILSTPNAAQQPTYTIFRDITQNAGQTNILGWSLEDNATGRHSEAVIYGRGGGRKAGRQKAKGLYADLEMQAWGYDQPIVIRDEYVGTGGNAAYFARRKLAEERRDGWRLEYTIAGHTLPFGVTADSRERAVVVPDTTVWVDDALSGIQGKFYVDTVRRARSESGGTVTTIRLVRPEDLVFGDIAAPAAPTVPKVQSPQVGPPLIYDYKDTQGVDANANVRGTGLASVVPTNFTPGEGG